MVSERVPPVQTVYSERFRPFVRYEKAYSRFEPNELGSTVSEKG